MGYTTTADEKLAAAKSNIKDAISNIKEIIFDEVWGHEEFSCEYLETITETLFELKKIQKRLG